MRTIYVNKDVLPILRESVLMDEMPSDVVSSIIQNRTSIGNNPAIPDIFDEPYILKVMGKRFQEVKETLKSIGRIDDVEETEINSALASLLLKCQKEEQPYRNELEKLCVNFVIDFFAVPEDSVIMDFGIVDKVDLDSESIILDPISGDGDDGLEPEDFNDAISVRDEVYKRRLLDAICMGAAIQISSNFESYEEDVNRINPNLMKMYKEIIALNNYSLFEKENIGMSDENKMQIGTSEVRLGDENTLVKICAQGCIFPILLSEAIRAFMELFISHGLPKDRARAAEVLGKSDYLKAEPWDMRVGPSLWTLLSNSFNDINSQELPYLLKRISLLSTDKFNYLMKEVFAKTRKGRELMASLSNKAKDDVKYDKFVDRMGKMKDHNGIITDEYMRPEDF